jgi:superfamily II DNA or RNA helicase
MQLQAGYILPVVHKSLQAWAAADESKQLSIAGLLQWITTFDVLTTLPTTPAEEVDSILAVATNLLTRGLPTIPSVFVEEELAKSIKLTERHVDKHLGKISFPFRANLNPDNDELLAALHPISPGLTDVQAFYDRNDLGSDFERAFITDYLSSEPFLAQLLQKQRPLSTVANGYLYGNIDFSLEIPSWAKHERLNRYKKPATLRYNEVHIAEVDGKAYHSLWVDNPRDFAVNSMGNTTTRVVEQHPAEGTDEYVTRLKKHDFVQRCEQNFHRHHFASDPATLVVLQPLAIARIQRTLLWYMMSRHWQSLNETTLRVAIVERDIEAGDLAVSDLVKTLEALEDTSNHDWARPQVQCECFGAEVIGQLNLSDYNLVIDHSMLRRSGIFAEDRKLTDHPNVIQLRNCHYVDDKTTSSVISAERVHYKVSESGPVSTLAQTDTSNHGLTKFLQDIFRKVSFRPGQLPILERAFAGKSVIGLLPTGGGKSLTYQLAALLQPGITIVVDPIRSLMADQDRSLREMLIDKTTFVNSTLTTGERTFVQGVLLPEGRLQFLFLSPERFVIQEFRNVLGRCGEAGHFTTYVIIDEAHCVSEWGHDFRIPYLNLGVNAQDFCPTWDKKPVPLFGLTATASFDVLADIERELQIKNDDGDAVVRFENTVRDEINYSIMLVPGDYEDVEYPLTKYDPNKIVGRAKQKAVFELLEGKRAILKPYDDYAIIREVAKHSYEGYLSDVEIEHVKGATNGDQDAVEWYCNETAKRVRFPDGSNPFPINDDGTFGYGVVVFAPHRSGWIGIKNGNESFGVFGNQTYVRSGTIPEELPISTSKSTKDRLGYFMGSSDENRAIADENDRTSFAHMDRFTNNQNSVMVATKAFGMGIDKSNIRLTVHLSLPSSIESYVQEAGRAGRDRKSALSVVLFNDEKITYSDAGQTETVNVDFEVLNFFHKRSFKGQMKERTMLFELRNEVKIPRIQRKFLIADQLQEDYPQFTNIQLKFWSNKFVDGNSVYMLYVNADEMEGKHYLNFGTGRFTSTQIPAEIQQRIRQEVQPAIDLGLTQIKNWLDGWITPEGIFTGVEKQFRSLKVGETGELNVYFTNQYYSQPTKSEKDFVLNVDHRELVYQQAVEVVSPDHAFATGIANRLREAVIQNLPYEGFIKLYQFTEADEQDLLDESNVKILKLQRAYYSDRNDQDTAKAIYRLISIGIIDTYTIDYQNKKYNLVFTKHEETWYFDTLQNFVARYSSRRRAATLINQLKKDKAELLEMDKATPISVCLEFLTDYIYDNIRRKRRQAINDMISLCRSATAISDDLTRQNLLIKDEIFFYFNAKYSRPGFIEPNNEQPASMPDDQEEDSMTIATFVEKYLRLVENTETGEFINNNKHLRGSCMRMLRSFPDEPQFFILKSFSLFVMANLTPAVRTEAIGELIQGLSIWRKGNPDVKQVIFMDWFGKKINQHVDYDVMPYIEEALEGANVLYYAMWLKQFNDKIIVTHE